MPVASILNVLWFLSLGHPAGARVNPEAELGLAAGAEIEEVEAMRNCDDTGVNGRELLAEDGENGLGGDGRLLRPSTFGDAVRE